MKITGIEVIPFVYPRPSFRNGQFIAETTARQTLTRILTDEGAEGLFLGGHGHGDQDGLTPEECAQVCGVVERLLVGQDPHDRERFWHWMWVANLPEPILSTIDMALWDLAARAAGLPVFKYAGGCRDRVLAYASTYPNMGMPEDYAQHALDCLERGYTAYKIHPYYFWDPETRQPDPGRPSHIAWDVRVCEAVHDAVGDSMILMYDPWGTYRTYEEALYIGRVLEELNFYWYEHPMPEYRVESYVRLSRELEIPVLSPEIAAGSIYTRADWILRGASDMSRMDVLRGGMTGMLKLAGICEAFGQRCEVHMSGFGNLQVLGATSEDVCEYYERGLEAPGLDYDALPPYLEAPCDPLDQDGYVTLPQEPGLGYRLNWDYIQSNRLEQ